MCAVHPARAAQRTCARCGRFTCAPCAGDRDHCPQCFTQVLKDLPSSAGRAQWAIRFLALGAAVDAASFVISAARVVAPGESVARDLIEGFSGLGILVAYIGAVITFLRWEHLSVRQLRLLGIEIGVTPGWAVGWWFVPFANLVRPFNAMRAILSGLGGEAAVAEARLSLWWTAWIISNVLSQIESRLALRNGLEGEPPAESHVAGIFASIAGVVAALLCIAVVKTVQKHLDQRSGTAAPASPLSAPPPI